MISRMTLQVRTNITALLSSKHTSRQISPGNRHALHDGRPASVLPDHHDCGNGACTGGWHKKQCKQPINLQQRLANCHTLPNILSASAYSIFTTVLWSTDFFLSRFHRRRNQSTEKLVSFQPWVLGEPCAGDCSVPMPLPPRQGGNSKSLTQGYSHTTFITLFVFFMLSVSYIIILICAMHIFSLS